MNVNYINYATLGMMKNAQTGSTKKEEKDEFNYTDGLSRKELAIIDVNADGAITEAEFATAFGGSDPEAYKTYWQTYSVYYNASTTDNITTQEKGDIKTVSTFEGDKMTSYTQTKITKDYGIEVKTFIYNEETKKYEETSTVTTYKDGSKIEKNTDGSEKYTWADGNQEEYDENGNLIKATTTDEKTGKTYTYEFEYKENGVPKSVKIDGKTYTELRRMNDDGVVFDANNEEHDANDFRAITFGEMIKVEADGENDEKEEFKRILSITFEAKGGITVKDYTEDEKNGVSLAFGIKKKAETVEKVIRDEKNNRTTIETKCQGTLLKEEIIEVHDGVATINEVHEYTYYPSGNKSEEIIRDRVTGNITKKLYEDGSDEPYFTSVKNNKWKTIEAEGTLESVLKEKYPNLSRVQIQQLAQECTRLNNLEENAVIKFDPVTNDYNIKFPKFTVDRNTDNLRFSLGSVEDFIKAKYKNENLSEKQLTQLINECLRINEKTKVYTTVTYDPINENYSIKIPEFEKTEENLIFKYGSLEDFLKENNSKLSTSQLANLIAECKTLNKIEEEENPEVTYDPTKESYNIKIPTYKIVDDELVIIS